MLASGRQLTMRTLCPCAVWWHQVQMMQPAEETAKAAPLSFHNVSLNFWFMGAPWEAGSPEPALPPGLPDLSGGGYVSPEAAAALEKLWPKRVTLQPYQLVGLGRDLEQTIAQNCGAPNVGRLLRKATPEGGACPGGWSPTLQQNEMPCVLTLNILLRSRGFDAERAAEFVQQLYRGRFEGLEQREAEQQQAPEWWR